MRLLARLVLTMLIAATAGTAFGQPPPGGRRPDGGRMSGEERQRFREDLQRQPDPRRSGGDPNNADRARRYAEWQRMSPEQREGLRREMRDYNRDHDRRR